MLAHRVVLKRGLECEPEEWLGRIDQETFDGWKAFYALEPWGDEQALLARIASYLSVLCAMKAGSEEFAKVEDFLPRDWFFRPKDELIKGKFK